MSYSGTSRKISRWIVGMLLCGVIPISVALPTQAQRQGVRRPALTRSPANQEDAYTLGGGDRIRIDNAKLPQYNGEYVIPAGGYLSLPLVGSISLSGLTLQQATDAMNAAYGRILKRPQIGVRLLEPRPIIIAISGEVNRPGSYTIPVIGREPGIRYPTVTQVIQQAEGTTPAADLRRIQVRRRQRSTSQVININLQAFLQSGTPGQDIFLRDGDTIFIPTANNLTSAQANNAATSSVATDLTKPRTVTVLGEVSNPGTYVLVGGNTIPDRNVGGRPTVTRAIQLAGGTTPASDIQQIRVRRLTKAGGEQIFNVNLRQYLQTGDSSQDLIVQEGDTIFIPTLTNITPAQANELATISLATDINKPRTVTVVGEVSNPGSYVVMGGNTATERNTGGWPTVTRAIQLAGGIIATSDIRQIQVRRSTKTGQDQIFNINLWEYLQTGDASQDLIVQEGDTIFIPTTTDFNPAQARQLASVSFAADIDKPRTVAVVGEVTRPGVYVLLGGITADMDRRTGGLPTVTRAIQRAGGITTLADIRQIEIRRTTRIGSEQIINVNLWQLLQSGTFTQDQIVQEGDTIFIPTAADINSAEVSRLAASSFSPNTIQVSVVGEVGKPGRIEVSPDTTLNQALLVAGGFNRGRAKRSSVELIRLNPNGTVSKQTVAINFNEGINDQTNPLLRNNDIIVVGRSGLARIADTLEVPVTPGFPLLRIFEILGIFQ